MTTFETVMSSNCSKPTTVHSPPLCQGLAQMSNPTVLNGTTLNINSLVKSQEAAA